MSVWDREQLEIFASSKPKAICVKVKCIVSAMAHPSHFSGAKTLFNLLTFLGIFDPDIDSPANFVTRFERFTEQISFPIFAPIYHSEHFRFLSVQFIFSIPA